MLRVFMWADAYFMPFFLLAELSEVCNFYAIANKMDLVIFVRLDMMVTGEKSFHRNIFNYLRDKDFRLTLNRPFFHKI